MKFCGTVPGLATFCFVFFAIATLTSPSFGQSSRDENVFDPRNDISTHLEEYERRLNAVLKTRRDEEKEFVSLIVKKIEEEKLPIKLIDTSFEWVRNKRSGTEYPFFYFERVLRIQATELGLKDEVPPFDYSIYKSAGQRVAGQQLNAGQKTEKQKETLLSRLFRFRRSESDEN